MDFGTVDLSDDTLKFWRDVADFFDEHATDAVQEEERLTGSGHNQALHEAMGMRGWLFPTSPIGDGGAGLDPLHARILQLEIARREVPNVTAATTGLCVPTVRQFGSDRLKQEVLPGASTGEVKICLGYTEPDGGSDLAAVRTRATRTSGGWLVNGAKMFTTGAQNCQYSMVVTRTDPEAPKHRGITIFLVPLDGPGVEIQPVHTLGGERTNAVFYDDVFVDDDHRLGPVNEGWSVMSGALDAEHGIRERDVYAEIGGTYGWHLRRLLWHATQWAQRESSSGVRLFDDPEVRTTLARIAVDVELVRNLPDPMGRVMSSELLIQHSAELVDLLGPEALLPRGADGAQADGELEAGHRFAQGTAIYGGTTEIARNIIAQHVLKLPRPPRIR